MIRRIWRLSPARSALFLCLAVLAVVLLHAPPVQASASVTLEFLQNFQKQIPQLKTAWSTSGSDYCTWEYITCNKTTGLASLELSGVGLVGRYPQVNNLDGSEILIESINMSFNPNFEASLRRDWYKLSYLRRLDLSSTRTDDELPKEWGAMDKLEFLNLSNTNVDHDIPDDWKGMNSLVVLDLRNTEVDDVDVDKVGAGMRSLEVLQLGETKVKEILDDLTSPRYFPRLRLLNVSYPRDTDTEYLPSSLATWASGLANLQYVNFDGFGFRGCVPDSYRAVGVLMQAARRANAGLVLRSDLCRSYSCSSPTELSDGTKTFLNLLRSSALMQGAASQWSGEDYCGWPGVDCPTVCGGGIRVDLSALPLSGAIPDVFDSLGDSAVLIDAFTVRNNAGLVGALPPSFATALSLVQRVELSSLALMGTIPAAFGSALRYIETLTITHTRLCGPLPNWSGTFAPPLRYADLSSNRMGGSLSASWATLPLRKVDLRRNDFCGCVPPSWRDKALLMNALQGSVVSAGMSPACGVLNGCGNANQQCNAPANGSTPDDTTLFLTTLRDSFPTQLASWGASGNYCDGSWRGVRCQWSSLGAREVVVELANAQLVGSLPNLPASVVGARVMVASINMSTNAGLTGSLPVSWGKLSYLRTLDLNSCVLQGDLPEAWEGMSSLETLLISGSSLCRGLPNWKAESMPKLAYFDVSANTMYGGLSDSFGLFGPQLRYFNVTKNKFCGCVPSSWKPYDVLVGGVDSDAAMSWCSLAFNACGRYSMRCESVDDSLLNFKDVNWNYLDLIKRHLSVKLDAATSSEAITIFATWSDYEFCNYMGVSCSFHNGNNGFALNLKGVGLKGTLPSIASTDFKSAVAARMVDLSNNPGITGTLPPSWGELTNLVYLDISNTSVQSAIPSSWQGMQNLLYLSASQTLLCGVLPRWSADALVSVSVMDLSHSKLAGALSDEWGTFGSSDLSMLRLEGNTGLCSCAPSAWLEGQVLPGALLSAFGTIPQISDTCASLCSSPPSCVDPEADDSGSAAAVPRSMGALHAVAVVFVVLLSW